MHITYRDKKFVLDRTALKACLVDQGWDEADIAVLNIYVKRGCPQTEESRTLGIFNGTSVFVYYEEDDPPKELDNTLLHECRHHWQKREEDHQFRIRLENAKGKRARNKVIFSWLDRRDPEKHLAYLERPSEIDARAFAERLAPQWSFFSIRPAPAQQAAQPAFSIPGEPSAVPFVPVPQPELVVIPKAIPSPTSKRSAISGAALVLALGVLLLTPWWHQEVKHA